MMIMMLINNHDKEKIAIMKIVIIRNNKGNGR